jgi:S1-C subfamily serine protease
MIGPITKTIANNSATERAYPSRLTAILAATVRGMVRDGGFWSRIVPRTALGLAGVLFLMSIAAAFTGAVLYAYYESRQEQTEQEVEEFVAGFADELEAAKQIIAQEGQRARDEVRGELEELEKFAASGGTLTALLEAARPSVWFVSTLDDAGGPAVGSAFVVFADSESSFLLTSFTTIRAATVQPAPAVEVVKGDERLEATLFNWDEELDMALLRIPKANLPALEWAPPDPGPRVGDRVFVTSGFGSGGGAISQGFVADVSIAAIQHDAPVGAAYQGGPLLDSNGQVIGMASRRYSPSGFDPLAVFFSPPIRAACETVVQCPSGTPTAPA